MITSELRGATGFVLLDRHERRNALDLEHCRSLRESVESLVEKGARALVLSGRGTTFCAGADLDGDYGESFRDALYAALESIVRAPVPVIAAVNGPAVGAGTQLALASDLRVATSDAFFAVPTAKNGLAVDTWTIRRLELLAGAGPARAMLLGAERVDAATAHGRGMVDRIGELDAALAWAAEIAEMAPLSLRYAKQALNGAPQDVLDAGYRACWSSEDVEEARRARAGRRPPEFRGR